MIGFAITAPGQVLVDHGPVNMTIQAWAEAGPASWAAVEGARCALTCLGELSAWLKTAFLPSVHPNCRPHPDQPTVLQRMIEAVRRLGQPDLTPMAAVAGSFSELVMEACLAAGADRVVVNNGGDIALRAPEDDRPFRVGIVPDLSRGVVERVLTVSPGREGAGVATSGFGGRSLSKGIASSVTCLAPSCALADAAATAVANACYVEDPAVERCRAEELDPMTDLKGHTVVKTVGRLSTGAVARALEAAAQKARGFLDRGLMTGCALFLQGRELSLPAGLPLTRLRVSKQAPVPGGEPPQKAYQGASHA